MSFKFIPLAAGRFAIVDAEDAGRLSKHKWRYACGYAVAWIYRGKKRRTAYMHREVMFAVTGETLDHINGNQLDNRKCNLRRCTKSQNLKNRKKNCNNTSGFKGVYWAKDRELWCAQISVNGKRISLGRFISKLNAALAYDAAAKKYFGEFARLNFP